MSGSEESRFHLEISQSRAAAFHYVPSPKRTSQSTIICMHAMSCGQHAAPQTHSTSSRKTVARRVFFLSVLKSIQHGETEPALLRIRETVLINIFSHFDSQIPLM